MGVLRYDTDDMIVETCAYSKKKNSVKRASMEGSCIRKTRRLTRVWLKKKKSVKRALIEGSCIRKTRRLTRTTSRRTRPIYRHPSSIFSFFFPYAQKKETRRLTTSRRTRRIYRHPSSRSPPPLFFVCAILCVQKNKTRRLTGTPPSRRTRPIYRGTLLVFFSFFFPYAQNQKQDS
jgi:hypothetical protein